MRKELIIVFGPTERVEVPLPAGEPLGAPDAGRRWLDDAFIAHDCEPLRASGKVLIADKLLALADTVGPRRFADDAPWALDFARAALAALARPLVRVDLSEGVVTC